MKQHLKLFFTALSIFAVLNMSGQTGKLKLQVDSLKFVSGDPLDCNAVTWRIIANKKDAIQLLIDKLDDPTLTSAKNKHKAANLAVADVAYLTLIKILPLPFFAVTGMQCDVIESDGYQQDIFEYMEGNRAKFKAQVQAYYDRKKDKLTWQQFDRNHLTPCYMKNILTGSTNKDFFQYGNLGYKNER